MPLGISCVSWFESETPRVPCSILFGAILVALLGNEAGAQDCRDEIRRIEAELEVMGEDAPGYGMLSRQVSRASDHCLAGQQGLYESFISAARAFLNISEDPQSDPEVPISFAEMTGQWCYEHESGERANYEFFEDGRYRAALAEMNWQWVIEGRAEEALPRATIVSAGDELVRLRIGAFDAQLTPGFCAGSRP